MSSRFTTFSAVKRAMVSLSLQDISPHYLVVVTKSFASTEELDSQEDGWAKTNENARRKNQWNEEDPEDRPRNWLHVRELSSRFTARFL